MGKSTISITIIMLAMLLTDIVNTRDILMINPGEEIGKTRIGVDFREIRSIFGEPDVIKTTEQSRCYTFRKEYLQFNVLKSNNKVFSIFTTAPEYYLPGEIRVAAPVDRILRTYGRPRREIPDHDEILWYYPDQGLIFRLRNDRIEAIGITEKFREKYY